MSTKPKRKPSFFKFLLLDFTSKLLIPPAFARDHEQILRGENFTVRIKSGETWAVKIVKMQDNKYNFTGGWDKFAKDVGLKRGEFLVFKLVAKSTFDVSVFTVTGCEREISAVKIENDDSGDECNNHNARDKQSKAPNHCASNSDHSLELLKSPLYFEVCLKKYQKARLGLSQTFCEAAGLMGKGNVRLEYLPKLHRCHQYAVLELKHRKYRVEMAAGWPEFKKANGLVFGKTYSFQWSPKKNVIQVQECVASCEREIGAVEVEDDDSRDDEVEYKNHNTRDKQSKAPKGCASNSDHSLELLKSPLYFEVRLKKHQRSRLILTMTFCRVAGLMDKRNVRLEYLPKLHPYQSAVLGLKHRKYRVEMAAGWAEFRKTNGLVFGKTYSFQWSPKKNVIQVQEVKKMTK